MNLVMKTADGGTLYAGDADDAIAVARAGAVDVVVDLRGLDEYDLLKQRAMYAAAGMCSASFPTDDGVPLDPSYLPAVVEFLVARLAAGDRVLLHCYAGMSRTGAALVAYIVRTQGVSPEAALAAAFAARHEVSPHPCLWDSVCDYAESLGVTTTARSRLNALLDELDEATYA